MLQKIHAFSPAVVLSIFLAAAFSPLSASAEGALDTREVARAQILGTWRGEPVTSAAVVDGATLASAERARSAILGPSLPANPAPFQGLAQAPLDHRELARRQILGISSAAHPVKGPLATAR